MYFFKKGFCVFEPFFFFGTYPQFFIFSFFTSPRGGGGGALNFVHPILKPPSQPFFFRPLV